MNNVMSEVSNLSAVWGACCVIPNTISQQVPFRSQQICKQRRYTVKYVVMIAVMVAVSIPCFARGRNSAQIYFPDAIRVGTTILPAGHYEMEWVVDSGAGVEVSFFQSTDTDDASFENKPFATVHAMRTPADNTKTGTSAQHTMFTQTQVSGINVLDEVEMPHLTFAFLGESAR
jgi:hypothetical protein